VKPNPIFKVVLEFYLDLKLTYDIFTSIPIYIVGVIITRKLITYNSYYLIISRVNIGSNITVVELVMHLYLQ